MVVVGACHRSTICVSHKPLHSCPLAGEHKNISKKSCLSLRYQSFPLGNSLSLSLSLTPWFGTILLQHPDDKNEEYFPKALVLLGLSLCEGSILLLVLVSTL